MSKQEFIKALQPAGAFDYDILDAEQIEWAGTGEGEEYWVKTTRPVTVLWGGVERVLPKGTTLGRVFVPRELLDHGVWGEDEALNFFVDSPECFLSPVAELERRLEDAE